MTGPKCDTRVSRLCREKVLVFKDLFLARSAIARSPFFNDPSLVDTPVELKSLDLQPGVEYKVCYNNADNG